MKKHRCKISTYSRCMSCDQEFCDKHEFKNHSGHRVLPAKEERERIKVVMLKSLDVPKAFDQDFLCK